MTAATLTRGHKKKARTRRLLLDTAREVLAASGEAFSVSDVALRAGVSHGTFYNYFADREELLAALAVDIVESFAARSALAVDEPDPVLRFARITARALESAVSVPGIVRVALRVEAAQRALLVEGPFAHLRRDLTEAAEAGRLPGPADDALLDVVAGGILLAARRIIDGDTSASYRRAVIRRLLGAVGIDPVEAAAVAIAAVP